MALLQRVEVWSSYQCNAGTRLAFVREPFRVEGQETLEGDDRVTVSMPADDQASQYCVARKIIRLVFDDATFTEWRIRATSSSIGDRGAELTVTATSPLLDLADATIISETQSSGVVDFDIGVVQATITEVINTYILALPEFTSGGEYDYFALGTIDPTLKYDINFAEATPLALLRELCLLARDPTTKKPAELRVRRNGTTSYLIDILTEIGNTLAVSDLRSLKNVRENELTLDTDEQYTKVYAFGADDGSGAKTGIQRALFTLDNLSGSTYEITDPEGGPSPVLENDQLNGMYVVPDGTGALIQITDSALGSPSTVTLASTTGITEGKHYELRADVAGKLNTALTSPSAVSSYGTKVGKVPRDDLFGARNFIDNPWFRTWTTPASPPDGWTVTSGVSGTTSQNTDPLYSEYGGQSWKITLDPAGGGVHTIKSPTFYARPVNGAATFSLKAHLFLESFTGDCTIRLLLMATSGLHAIVPIAQATFIPPDYPIASTAQVLAVGDYVDIGIEGIDLSAVAGVGLQLHVEFNSHPLGGGAPGALTAYPDATMLTQTAKVPPIWIEYSGSNALWHAANLVLANQKDPLDAYEAEVVDLTRADGTTFPHTALSVGASVRLTIPEQGIAESALRVIGKPLIDYLVPKRTRIELASRRRLLASLLGGNSGAMISGSGGGSGTGTTPTAPGTGPGGGGQGPPGPPGPSGASRLLKTIWSGRKRFDAIPAAATEHDTDDGEHFFVDLTGVNSVFLSAPVVSDGGLAAAGELRIKYIRPSDSTERYLDGTSGPAIAVHTAGLIVGTSVGLEPDALGPRWCKVESINGDGTSSPVVGQLQLHGGVMSSSIVGDWAQLIQQLGGDAEVPFFYDFRHNVTLASGKVNAIDDVRGASGFGPQLSGGTDGDYDSLAGEVQLDNGEALVCSSPSAKADLSAPLTLVYVGTVPGTGTGSMYVCGVGDALNTTFFGVRAGASFITGEALASGTTTTLASAVANDAAAVRLCMVAQDGSTGMTLDVPSDTQETGSLGAAMTPTSASICLGEKNNGDSAHRGDCHVRAFFGVKHVLTATEQSDILNWALVFRGVATG